MWLSRRQMLLTTCSALALAVVRPTVARSDAEFPIEAPTSTPSGDYGQSSPDEPSDLDGSPGLDVGGEYRFPTCGFDRLTPAQLGATNTPAAAPSYLSEGGAGYFSDDFGRAFSSESPDCMTLSARKIGGTRGDKFHLYRRPTDLPPGESVFRNADELKSLFVVPKVGPALALGAAIQNVRNSGKWNYKRSVGSGWEDAGNFNFGAIVASLGLNEELSLRLAGLYGEFFGEYDPSWGHFYDSTGSFGDDWRDQEIIRGGYEYYNNAALIDTIYGTGDRQLSLSSWPSAPLAPSH